MLCERCGINIPDYESFCPGCGAYKYWNQNPPAARPIEAATVSEAITYIPAEKSVVSSEASIPIVNLPYRWGKCFAVLQMATGIGCFIGAIALLKEEWGLSIVLIILGVLQIFVGRSFWKKEGRWALNLFYVGSALSIGANLLSLILRAINMEIGQVIAVLVVMAFAASNWYYFYKRSDEFN
jgi:hypothetical protein